MDAAGICDASSLNARRLDRDRVTVSPTDDRLGPASACIATGDECTVSGYRVRSLAADELIIAVTAIPRQFQELLAGFGLLDDIDGPLRTRCPATGWSPLERIGHVSDSLHAAAKTTVAVLHSDRKRFRPVHIDAARAGVNAMPSRAVLAALEAAASDLAHAALSADGQAWERDVQLGSRTSNVREVLSDAVHDARHHLADVRVALEVTIAANPAMSA